MAYDREASIDKAYNVIQQLVKQKWRYGGYYTYDVTRYDLLKLAQVGDKYGVPFEWLINLIKHESAATFNPAIKNSIGATGLIQFMTRISGKVMSYAKADGSGAVGTDRLRLMTFSQQLDYVDGFLSRGLKRLLVNGKVTDDFNQGQLFMTIFYPVAVKNPNYVFPASVQRANGVVTPKDYVKKALVSVRVGEVQFPIFPLDYYPYSIKEAKAKFSGNIIPPSSDIGEEPSRPNAQNQNQSPTDPQSQEKKTGDITQTAPKPKTPTNQISRVFSNTLQPQSIELIFKNTNRANQQLIAQNIGMSPLLFYNTVMIDPKDLIKFKLFHEDIIPKIECTIFDTYGIFRKTGLPTDDTKVSLFINSKSYYLSSITADFKIIFFKELKSNTYILHAVIDVPGLYTKEFRSYPSMTSFEAMKEVAKSCGLGFVTNVTETSDTQTWINTGKTNREFLKIVTDRSYISDQSFQVCYIDLYYNLCFVDLSKEFRRNIDEDVAINGMGFDRLTHGEGKTQIDDQVIPMILTTDRNLNVNVNYIEKFTPNNNSTSISVATGYRSEVKFLDELKKEIVYFKIESQTDDAKKNQPLKSNSGDNEFFEQHTRSVYSGKLSSTDDQGGQHSNSLYTLVNNRRNISEMAKLSSRALFPNYNLNLYLFRKVAVQVILPSATPAQPAGFDVKLTGNWMVSGIEYHWSDSKTKMYVDLVRRSVGKDPSEEDPSPPQNIDRNNVKTEKNPPDVPPPSQEKVSQQQEQTQESAPLELGEFGDMGPDDRVPPTTEGSFSSPSKFPIKSTAFRKSPRTVENGLCTQIVLHYTGGFQVMDKTEGTIQTLMSRSHTKGGPPLGLSYHYIIAVDGHVENVVDPKWVAFHATSANNYSVGISLQCLGITYGDKSIEGANKSVDAYRKNGKYPLHKRGQDYVKLVDFNGNPASYRGFKIGQEVSDEQLRSLAQVLKKVRTIFPTIPAWTGLTQDKFDQLFPQGANGEIVTSWKRKQPGLYSHCSVVTDKFDILPTPKMINFLKRIRF